jgi:hypothetical protein
MAVRTSSDSSLSVEIRDSIISHNRAGPQPDDNPGRGGGISAYAGYGNGVIHLSIINSIIARNQARSTGGGLELNASENGSDNSLRATIINSTITGNETNMHDKPIQDEGGGIRVYTYSGERASTSLEMYNTIVYGNDARGSERSEDLYVSKHGAAEASVAAYHCDIGEYVDPLGLYAATDVIKGDPLFFDPENDDYRLRGGSPCIDAGTTAIPIPPGLPASDLDGDARVIGAAPDIGADEARPPVYLPVLYR